MNLDTNVTVQRQQTIYGWTVSKPVQIYVLSKDKKYYLQPPVTYYGDQMFSANCYFGDENSVSGEMFQVIALVTSERPSSPIDQLPANVEKSDPLVVVLQ